MNILVDELPTAVLVDDQEVDINTDFRDALRVIMAFEDNDLTNSEKALILIANLYPDPPDNIEEAVRQGVKFLDGGQARGEGEDEEEPLRLYSFSRDARLIFAAFRQTHGIDLQTVQMHWWEFMALFMDLGADTAFCSLTALRRRVKTGKATKDEQEAARLMGDLFDVPEVITPTEKAQEAEFLKLVAEGQKNREK